MASVTAILALFITIGVSLPALLVVWHLLAPEAVERARRDLDQHLRGVVACGVLTILILIIGLGALMTSASGWPIS